MHSGEKPNKCKCHPQPLHNTLLRDGALDHHDHDDDHDDHNDVHDDQDDDHDDDHDDQDDDHDDDQS